MPGASSTVFTEPSETQRTLDGFVILLTEEGLTSVEGSINIVSVSLITC